MCYRCSQKAPVNIYNAALLAHEGRPDPALRPAVRPGRAVVRAPDGRGLRAPVSPWTAATIKKKEESAASRARAEYHAQFVLALGESCPEHLREHLPAPPDAPDDQADGKDTDAICKQLRHELAQSLKSIQASEQKIESYKEDIRNRTTRNAEIEAALHKHELDLALAVLPACVEGEAEQARALN